MQMLPTRVERKYSFIIYRNMFLNLTDFLAECANYKLRAYPGNSVAKSHT